MKSSPLKMGPAESESGSAERALCLTVPPEADSEMKLAVALWKYDVKLQQLILPLMVSDGTAASALYGWVLNIRLQERNWVRLPM